MNFMAIMPVKIIMIGSMIWVVQVTPASIRKYDIPRISAPSATSRIIAKVPNE